MCAWLCGWMSQTLLHYLCGPQVDGLCGLGVDLGLGISSQGSCLVALVSPEPGVAPCKAENPVVCPHPIPAVSGWGMGGNGSPGGHAQARGLY